MNQKTLLVIIASVAMVAGYWFSSNLKKPAPEAILKQMTQTESEIQGFVLDPARSISMPPLRKDDGSLFINDDLKDHWSLLFFGYTHCPDICPATMNVLAQSLKRAKDQKITFPEVFFISVDPQRDSVEMLGEYVRYFDPSFRGVTGEPNTIEALTLQAGVVFMQTPVSSENKDDYLVDHSSSILLISPEGKLKAYLKPPHTAEGILKSLKTVTEDS